jgi:hypothetical protein
VKRRTGPSDTPKGTERSGTIHLGVSRPTEATVRQCQPGGGRLQPVERLLQVPQQIVSVLDADGQPDKPFRDAQRCPPIRFD